MKRHDIRKKRLESTYRDIISQALQGQIQDSRLAGHMITITDVSVDDDFEYAKVRFTTLDETAKKQILKGLQSSAGFLFSLLREKIQMRAIPKIQFFYDEEIRTADSVLGVIQKLSARKGQGLPPE